MFVSPKATCLAQCITPKWALSHAVQLKNEVIMEKSVWLNIWLCERLMCPRPRLGREICWVTYAESCNSVWSEIHWWKNKRQKTDRTEKNASEVWTNELHGEVDYIEFICCKNVNVIFDEYFGLSSLQKKEVNKKVWGGTLISCVVEPRTADTAGGESLLADSACLSLLPFP